MLYYDAWIFRYEQSKLMALLKICMHWKYAKIIEWKKNMHGPDCSGPGANEARVSAACVCSSKGENRAKNGACWDLIPRPPA